MPDIFNAPTPAKKEETKFNLHKVLAAIGLILVVTIIIGSGIWFFGGGNELFNTGINTDNTIATSSAALNTNNWITYTNKAIAFTIKYPSDWIYNDYSINKTCSQDQVFFSPSKALLGICASGFGGLVSISRTQPADNLTREIALYKPTDYTNFKQADTTVGGKKAVKITGISQISNQAADMKDSPVIIYIVDLSDRALTINYTQNKNSSGYSAIFEKMVGTLKFN